MNKVEFLVRAVLSSVVCLLLLAGGTAFFFAAQPQAHAEIYWEVSNWQSSTAFHRLCSKHLGSLGMRPESASRVKVNGRSGLFIVMSARPSVPKLLDALEKKFSDLQERQFPVGRGENTGFVVVQNRGEACVLWLIRDENIKRTMVMSLMTNTALFTERRGEYEDAPGRDPVPMLRPPASQRMFSFEMGNMAFAAYRSQEGSLRPFYWDVLEANGANAVSVMVGRPTPLPRNGDCLFYELRDVQGCVSFQSGPHRQSSYSIVIAQDRKTR